MSKVSPLNPAGAGRSRVVNHCQTCHSEDLRTVIFLGYLPPVNKLSRIGTRPAEQPGYPALVLQCQQCKLVQLGLVVDPQILFPKEYPYTSSTTEILRENFKDLYAQAASLVCLRKEDLIVDIGSNDGNLLSNFMHHHRVVGVTPEDIGKLAIAKGIPTIQDYFGKKVVKTIARQYGKARIITATNVFAHIENVHEVLKDITDLLVEDGVFISESHYLSDLIETLQYDTIYHEHLRYYTLHSLKYLLAMHGLEVFHAKRIRTHGGSIRVYAARKAQRPVDPSVTVLLEEERRKDLFDEMVLGFEERVVLSKLALHQMLYEIKKDGKAIMGIGAPSRASTLINYVGLDQGILNAVLEVKGSYKIGHYIPGTLIPIEEESRLYADQPEYALMLSWHIAEELAPKIKRNGYNGDFIIPLPVPRILKNTQVS